jgi:superfamily I DNA/RNA helicase
MSLPELVAKQANVVALPATGHQVVLGTAGTGKTTMAMWRAAHLARPQTRNAGPVLLVTYNNALVTYLRHLSPEPARQVTVETYGRFARGYLNQRGLMPSWGGIATPAQRRSFVSAAVVECLHEHPRSRLLSTQDTGFFLDELEWISGMGIRTLSEYQATKRYGRQSGLQDQGRERIWQVRSAYLRNRDAAGPRYDWYDIATAVRQALAADTDPRKYRHVVIDEGQDFSPEQVRSLTEAVPAEGSVSFFGDYHQAIYGQGLSWRASGLNVARVERFRDNYRNTGEIARLAIAMAASKHMSLDVEDLVEPRAPRAAGPKPTLVRCKDRQDEIEVVRLQAADLAIDRPVAVLARTWADAERATAGLSVRKLDPEMRKWDPSPGIYIGAYHSGKGLEFGAVVLPFLGSDRVPLPEVVTVFGEDEASAREARLLYVALTRARTDLLLTYSGERTALLPNNPALYTEVDR